MIGETWKELMDYIFELDNDIVVIIGYSDITHKEGYSSLYFKDLNVDSFRKVIGRGDNEIKAILKYYSGDYSVGENGYFEIEHIEYNFIQTFLEREREFKLNEIFDFDI